MSLQDVYNSTEYKLIKNHYADSVAKRSQVPLINHIDEGLIILSSLQCSRDSMKAYCLHPLLQDDEQFKINYRKVVSEVGYSKSVELSIQYRYYAMQYLCRPHTDDWEIEDVSLMMDLAPVEVRFMLIADKVQNKKDFMAFHYGSHERSEQLFIYFNLWLQYLGVSYLEYEAMTTLLENKQ